MALPSFCGEAVTVSRAPLAASRGTVELDWSRAASHVVRGCSTQPSSTSTDRGEPRSAVGEDAVLFAPPGSDVMEGDRVTCRLGTFVVDGEPMAWESPTDATSHVRATLRSWRG